jgi:uncharacterized membrane protein
MPKNRLEAFSDGVIAVIITIMVLDMKVPQGADFAALKPVLPVFLSYVLSFVYVGIYWNNHHHMLHTVTHVNGPIMWANLQLLFWQSLIPFVTRWMGENQIFGHHDAGKHFDALPTALYGFVLLMGGFAFLLLQRAIVASHGRQSLLAEAIGHNRKGKISLLFYAIAIGLAFVNPWLADALYLFVAAMWFIPDRRIERAVTKHGE